MSTEPREQAGLEAASPPAAAAAASAPAAAASTAAAVPSSAAVAGAKGGSREPEAWGQVFVLSEAETRAEQDAVGDVDPLELLPPLSSHSTPSAAAAGGEDSFRMPLLQDSSPGPREKGEAEASTGEPCVHQQQRRQQGGSENFLCAVQRLLSALGVRCLGALLRPLVLGSRFLLPGPIPQFHLSRFLLFIGPGWLVAMAYVDPGNLEADLQASSLRSNKPPAAAAPTEGGGEAKGASGEGGYEILWLLLWGHAVGWVFQVLAARLGNVTDRDLASLCGQEYGRVTCIVLWILAELAILGADLQAVIGSALALQLLLGLPLWLGVCLTLVDCLSVLVFKGGGSRALERFFGCLLLVMATGFGVLVCFSRPSAAQLLRGLLLPSPPTSSQQALQLLSMLGCILMPHGLYLHSALVRSRAIARDKAECVAEANFYFAIEAALALIVSFLLNSAVVCIFSSPAVSSAKGLSLATAPQALRKAFGSIAFFAWGLGLLAAAQNATLAGTYAGQFVMQGFLSLRCRRSVRLLLTRLITIGPLLLLLLLQQETVDSLSEGVNLLQALLLPLALLPLLAFNSSHRVMGPFALRGWRRSAAFGLGIGLACVNCCFVLLETFANARSYAQQTLLLLALGLYTAGLTAAALRPVKGDYCLCFLEAQRQQAMQQQLQLCSSH